MFVGIKPSNEILNLIIDGWLFKTLCAFIDTPILYLIIYAIRKKLGLKVVEENEKDTVVLQRRSLRATRELISGERIKRTDFFPLRPCPEDALLPSDIEEIVDRELKDNILKGDVIKWENLK